ncbi:hypothetical protein [Actinomadura violacea]|uniref:Phosphoadenosine phosphosulfate reductase n=1 Tax=Actinomadura violacea TaxID=2819934 RepID=A0ABS3RY24_9ACTN|nr:hypothetical protein [Actinomadura violacea]MBO2461640.1 hypothetical protein [Actinomadura violacea]
MTAAGRPLAVNFGLGADSGGWVLLLLSVLAEQGPGPQAAERLGLPADTDLSRVVVVTAMTGSEHPDTVALVEEHILPRLAAAGLPYAQVARPRGGGQGEVTVLELSTSPSRLHADGDLRLYEEMTRAGTVPTTGLVRKCSIHAKGWPTDAFLDGYFGGEPFYQVMGFEDSKHERRRAKRDAADGDSATRTGVYPLITLGWDRARCLAYIAEQTGATWRKSACGFCPFRMTNKAGLAEVVAEYRARPELAVEALVMEHGAVALNPSMGLVAGKRLWNILAATPGMEPALLLAEEHLDAAEWGVYEVRRAFKAKKREDGSPDRTTRGYTARSLMRLGRGTRAQTSVALEGYAAEFGIAVDDMDARFPRVWLERRAMSFPTVEHLLVAAPACVEEKQAPGFATAWAAADEAAGDAVVWMSL